MTRTILSLAAIAACGGDDNELPPADEQCSPAWNARYPNTPLSGMCSARCASSIEAPGAVCKIDVNVIDGNTGEKTVEERDCDAIGETNLHDGRPVCCVLKANDGTMPSDIVDLECK
jgi:hypothetical protein